jgi:HAD superfamily hydrolase (TIGR01484 family)
VSIPVWPAGRTFVSGMYFQALATDYDGTLAESGQVSEPTLAALGKLKETGRRLILVTGRHVPDLKAVFPKVELFDSVVAENGAVLYTPATREQRILAEAPPDGFVERLKEKGVDMGLGEVVISTSEDHKAAVLDAIQEFGLELEITFNKSSAMVLPSGVTKASGLAAALEKLGLSFHNVVGIGDAENDHALLRASGHGVAVANALSAVKETADSVMGGAAGEGVVELVEALVERDAGIVTSKRFCIELGKSDVDEAVFLSPYGHGVLMAGSSGVGKSTLATALTERFVEKGFQFCVLDPEGDYQELENAVTLGDRKNPPTVRQACELLSVTKTNLVINTLGLKLHERPAFFAEVLSEIAKLRARTGRPHWLIIDEAHHLMPATRDSTALALPREMPAAVLITVHPEAVSKDVLADLDALVTVGKKAPDVLRTFCSITGDEAPRELEHPSDEQVLYFERSSGKVALLNVGRPRQVHKRHTRKYAEGDLGEARSFYFRGPQGSLNLKAQNLEMFLQLAEGVDDPTWEYHLREGHYSEWFRRDIRDEELAAEAEEVEADEGLGAKESRSRIAEHVRRRYTAPATSDR